MPRHSQFLFAAAVLFAGIGAAGLILHSFASPLALLLAALFGLSGAATLVARSARQRGMLLGFVIAAAVVGTYVFVVSGGGGAPPVTPVR